LRIRSRLLLLVAAVLVPALVGAGIGVGYLYVEEQQFTYASMRETARALAIALDREMRRREAVLATLAESPALAGGDLAYFHRYASTVAARHEAAIILSDLEGRQLLNTRLPYGGALPPMLAVERETRARLGNEVLVISDLYEPPAGLGPHSFALQVPVRRDGRVVRFLTMASFAQQIQKLFAEQSLPAGWHATIVDRQGVVVARSAEPQKFIGRRVRPELAAKIAAEPEGFHQGTNLSGVGSTAFFSRAHDSGWVFLLAVPHSMLYGPAIRATALMGAITLVLLGLGLAAAFIAARRISGPVVRLRDAAERLGRNEPVLASRSGTLELDAVGEAMAGASERLRGATAELEERVTEAVSRFERSQQALVQSQKLEALGRLTGGIAHDFNNVLQTLTAGLEALRYCPPSEHAELLARCERALVRGSEVARQLMAFGRLQEVRVETVDTACRLAEARALLEGALPSNLRLQMQLPPGLWPVTVDPAQLELALLNLVINARDAMGGGGAIVLKAANETLTNARDELRAGDYVLLAVVDTGEGMTGEVMARALDPFFTTKGIGKGSGMGLPQAYGFAKQSGGTLELRSARGQGTTALLYLPRALHAPEATPASPWPAQRLEHAAAGQGRVLLVEDDEEVRQTMAAALRAAGFALETAASAGEALERIDGGARYDAVLTDIVMPGALSGIDLAARLRRHHPSIGVVVVTGYTDRAVDLPGVRTLAKPHDVRQAVEALNDVIAAAATSERAPAPQSRPG
jgi:signal transduction histidine kinase/ActR/RegA family two-component response regulator